MLNSPETNEALAGALAESLMTMAFLDAFPAAEAPEPTAPTLLIRVPFSGARRGALEIMTTESVGASLAANMLGITPDDPDAPARGRDALKELANVTCGLLLSRLPDPTKPAMSVPSVRESSADRWAHFARRTDAAVLDVEGAPLVARVRGAA